MPLLHRPHPINAAAACASRNVPAHRAAATASQPPRAHTPKQPTRDALPQDVPWLAGAFWVLLPSWHPQPASQAYPSASAAFACRTCTFINSAGEARQGQCDPNGRCYDVYKYSTAVAEMRVSRMRLLPRAQAEQAGLLQLADLQIFRATIRPPSEGLAAPCRLSPPACGTQHSGCPE